MKHLRWRQNYRIIEFFCENAEFIVWIIGLYSLLIVKLTDIDDHLHIYKYYDTMWW